MATIRTAHPIRIAIVICAMALPSLFLCAPAANAGVLEQSTGQVEEVVSPVVTAPPVQQVGETVTTTADEVPANVAPSTTEAAEAASPPAADAAGASAQAAEGVAAKVRKPAGGSEATAGVESVAGGTTQTAETATRSAGAAVHGASAGAEEATGATLPDPSVASPAVGPVGSGVDPARSRAAPGAAGSEAAALADSAAAAELPPPAPRTTYVPPPGGNGSTGAPLPRWVAYVWPAVALTGPGLANLAENWSQAIVRLATAGSAGSGAEGGVAGVHASGGRPEANSNSAPLFSRLPSDVASAFASVPTPIFIYLGLLLLAVIAVGLAVKREIAAGRRW